MRIYEYSKRAVFILSVLVFLFCIFFFQVIPLYYTLSIFLISIALLFILTSIHQKYHHRLIYYLKECITIILIILYLIASFSLYRLHQLAYSITTNTDEIVLISANSASPIILGVYNMDTKLIRALTNTMEIENIIYFSSITSLSKALKQHEVTHIALTKEIYDDLSDFHYLKTTFDDVENVSLDPNYQNNKNSFNILLSGTDSLSNPNIDNRSDMNMLISINIDTQEMLFTSIPRDLYVPNPCLANKYDKLTHISLYSMNCLTNAYNSFINSDIDYFVRISFSSVINIVDTLNGLEIDVPLSFNEYDEYKKLIHLNKGLQTLNGKQVLALARHRKSLKNGDFDRNKNQQLILKALIKKVSNIENLLAINNILEIIEDNVYTNISVEDMYYYLSYAPLLSDFKQYSQNIYGSFENKETASMRGYKLAVVLMNPDNLKQVNHKIDAILNPLPLSEFSFNINNIT